MSKQIHSILPNAKRGSLLTLVLILCISPVVNGQQTQQAVQEATEAPATIQESKPLPLPQSPSQTQPPYPTQTPVAPPYTEDRLNAINKRIELLKTLYKQGQNRDSDSTKPPENANNPIQVPPQLNAPDGNPPGSEPTDPSTYNLNGDATSGNKTLESETLLNPAAASQPPLQLQMLNKPADSLELGNSLYWTRNYETAIRAFEKGNDKSRSIEDSVWMKCASACCQRQLERWDESEDAFRKITEGPKAVAFVHEYAQWNLTYIDRVRSAHQELQMIEQQIEALKSKEEGAGDE